MFLVAEGCGPQIAVEGESAGDIVLQLLHFASGELVKVNQGLSGMEQLSSAVVHNGPYVVGVYQFGGDPSPLQVHSTCELLPFKEDDGPSPLRMGESRWGALDCRHLHSELG